MGTRGRSNGGVIMLRSSSATTSIPSAPNRIDVSGGAAGTKGLAGTVLIDGAVVTSHWTH